MGCVSFPLASEKGFKYNVFTCLLENATVHYQPQLTLNWNKCQDDVWCPLMTLNLSHDLFSGLEGIYIIWHGGPNPRVVYVGQGIIADRLRAHREELRDSEYARLGLFVTWAYVDAPYRDGVERFLAERLPPSFGERHPTAGPVSVNLPW